MDANTTAPPVIIVEPRPKTAWEQHNDLQSEFINGTFTPRIVKGEKIDPQEIEVLLSPTYDNSILREFAVRNGICSKLEFKSMLRVVKIRHELGSIPGTPTDLVKLVVKRDNITCQYDGTLTKKIVPYMIMEGTGEKIVITQEDIDSCDQIATHVQFMFRPNLNTMDFERDLRILNDNLKLGFSRDSISDALVAWYEQAKKERLLDLFMDVGHAAMGPSAQAQVDTDWMNLIPQLFDTTEDSPEFVVAVLKKFIWQTKRKMAGLPVTNHLMPVILGPQGVGKTTFVNKLIGPLKELALEVDFQMIEDERNIDIWSSYILFLDEMGYASKANVDAIKHAITATSLARRPMRTNSKAMVDQKATFIGCSNKTLAQLIKDPTGIRRFVGIQFLNKPSRDAMNNANYLMLWQSVDVNHADPMLSFIDVLAEKQEEDRELGIVETWLNQFDPHATMGVYGSSFAEIAKNGRIGGLDLYQLFAQFQDAILPGTYGKINALEFGHEMKRLMKNNPEKVPFKKGPRSSKGVTWEYTGPMNVTPIIKSAFRL